VRIDEHASQEELAKYAYVVGDNEDGRLPLDQIHWSFEEVFPIERLLEVMSAAEWRQWFDDELAMRADERGTDRDWRRLLEEDIEEPVVILDHDGILIWDGWHRVAASVIKGVAPKVVLGVERRLDHDLPPLAPSLRM
jgi:hypothetical protein